MNEMRLLVHPKCDCINGLSYLFLEILGGPIEQGEIIDTDDSILDEKDPEHFAKFEQESLARGDEVLVDLS